MMDQIPVKKLKANAVIPTYGSIGAAGADLYACLEESIQIEPGETKFIPTGIAMEIPAGYAGLAYARSGLACKQDLAPANKVGVIDSDYRGEFIIALHNHGREVRTVEHGERIAQLVITPVFAPRFIEVMELSDTKRGTCGFGSTGK